MRETTAEVSLFGCSGQVASHNSLLGMQGSQLRDQRDLQEDEVTSCAGMELCMK